VAPASLSERRGIGGRTGLHSRRWLATIGADLVCFTALHLLAAESSLNYQALLVLPVLMAGILTPRLMALGDGCGRDLDAAAQRVVRHPDVAGYRPC
jgi:hypothetical protein